MEACFIVWFKGWLRGDIRCLPDSPCVARGRPNKQYQQLLCTAAAGTIARATMMLLASDFYDQRLCAAFVWTLMGAPTHSHTNVTTHRPNVPTGVSFILVLCESCMMLFSLAKHRTNAATSYRCANVRAMATTSSRLGVPDI